MNKQFYRDTSTGELAYLVDDELHGLRLRLNRPSEEIYFHVNKDPATGEINGGRWQKVEDKRPLTPMHVAEVTYSADQALCKALGIMNRKGWSMMKDEERIKWAKIGPPADEPARVEMYGLLNEYLRSLIR